MANAPSKHASHFRWLSSFGARDESGRYRRRGNHRRWGFPLLLLLLVPLVFAQSSPRVTALEPTSGKVNDDVTVTGENLGKDSVANVSQVITVDRTFLTEKCGRLPSHLIRSIDEGLRLALSL